ncbi:glycosyltransferase family 4 protein [Pseudomonas fluorescens]|uniref:glycosyltransferase family 4 protein n=1 Tax=Pseudomonas fluorescens TaxID=294 RepID=UPI0007D05431|nr:glycosyltransferase family 4 protein [Pseudomonas fluorescens]
MKIALCSTMVPFVFGGGRNIVDWLATTLQEAGHQVEIVYLPEIDNPDTLFQQMMALRWVDLESADRIICFRPQSHLIPHRHKILWFIHHVRIFYDLWESEYRPYPDDEKFRGFRDALFSVDDQALREAKAVFTNSKVVSTRLERYNGVKSEVLYPPVFQPERYHCSGQNDEIVYICRLEHHKRQHLLVEAMALTKTPVRLRLLGSSAGADYPKSIEEIINAADLTDRVFLDNRWITEEEKVEQFAECLAAAYLPVDEDSYGYPSLEASHSSKAILTTTDSGGVLELVQDGFNGLIAEPTPESLAAAMDSLYLNRSNTAAMGVNAKQRLVDLNISWKHVLERLLA